MIGTAALCGAGAGFGVALVIRGLVPRRLPLRVVLAGTGNHRSVASDQRRDAIDRIGGGLVPLAQSLGLSAQRLSLDLHMIGRTTERHLAEKLALALFGCALVPVVAGGLAAGGVGIPWSVPLWVAILVGIVFFFIPDFGVRSEAEERRRAFRHSLGAFLDLVVIGLSGGGGVEGALEAASEVSNGTTFLQLRSTLSDARLRGESPWFAFGCLGEETGVGELVELAASVGLAGTEGAKVRASLAAKAQSLRQHQLAETESAAQSASEQMSVPVVLLFAGFLTFIGWPALASVMSL